jgi:ParB family transcriptional regulator, chromosome partitioning protein
MQSKKRALGRGLGALLPPKSAAPAPAATAVLEQPDEPVNRLSLDALTPNPYQPRDDFKEEALNELAASIRQHGLIQPVAVTKRGDSYMIVAGERRWRAARIAGLNDIPVVVLDLNEEQILEFALIENLQRENLNAVEEAKAYRALIDSFGLSQEQVADRVGKSRPAVANSLRLLRLEAEYLRDIEAGLVSAGHARALLSLERPEWRKRLREAIVRDQLSVRETESLAVALANRKVGPRGAKRALDPHVQRLREALIDRLACKVEVKTFDQNKGKIEIFYDSLDELERLLAALSVEV